MVVEWKTIIVVESEGKYGRAESGADRLRDAPCVQATTCDGNSMNMISMDLIGLNKCDLIVDFK